MFDVASRGTKNRSWTESKIVPAQQWIKPPRYGQGAMYFVGQSTRLESTKLPQIAGICHHWCLKCTMLVQRIRAQPSTVNKTCEKEAFVTIFWT